MHAPVQCFKNAQAYLVTAISYKYKMFMKSTSGGLFNPEKQENENDKITSFQTRTFGTLDGHFVAILKVSKS
jgi:hypothetical protein